MALELAMYPLLLLLFLIGADSASLKPLENEEGSGSDNDLDSYSGIPEYFTIHTVDEQIHFRHEGKVTC